MEQSNDLIEEKDGFDWDAQMQGLVLSSFSFGYITTQLVGGILAERFGAKWIFGVCILLCSLLEFAVPLAAKGNVFALMGVRAIQGGRQFKFQKNYRVGTQKVAQENDTFLSGYSDTQS